MTAMVAPSFTTNKSNRWKQCLCCPYGYHIDVDFVQYCESVVTSQVLPRPVGYTRRPKNRASMEVLLGIPPITSPRLVMERESSEGDLLLKAVKDFERTLERTSRKEKEIKPFSEHKDETTQHSMNWLRKKNLDHKNLALIYPLEKSVETTDSMISNDNDLNSTVNPTDLHVIRQQMASSLNKIRSLEEEVKLVPELQAELSKLHKENDTLKKNLKKFELDEIDKTIQEKDTIKFSENNNLKKRNIAVGTSLVTRDVGINHKLPLCVTKSIMTDHFDVPIFNRELLMEKPGLTSAITQTDKFYEVSLSNRSSQTLLKMDAVYSSSDLERNIDKAIKLYEKTFHNLLHPKKAVTMNAGVQVEQKSPIITRDFGVQERPSTRNIGSIAKYNSMNSGVQTVKNTRDVGVSEDTVLNSCSKCSVTKIDIGVNAPYDTRERKYLSFNGRSKSFDTTEVKRKKSKSIAVGPDKSVVSSKSTDTVGLKLKKDVAINTTKQSMVDAAVDSINFFLMSKAHKIGGTSKIPRPVRRPFKRQNTYTIHATKSFQSDPYEIESGSEEGGYHSLRQDPTSAEPPDSCFQPIISPTTPRMKKELSNEMKGALKVLNDGLINIKEGNVSFFLRNAINIVQQEWFKVSSSASADPLEVEEYLDNFEEYSSELLRYIVNMTDNTGNTAMHYAVSHGNFDVVSILLDSKVCDINKRNSAGYTCIMLVSLAEVKSLTDRQVVRRLFQLADVNIRAKQHGQTALMLAVSHGRIDMVELLLDSGADINIQDEDGSTALMCAAEHDHVDMVKFLLAQPDCDLSITDCDGNTALNIAMEAGNRDIGVLLYAQQHFSRGGSPYTSFKVKRSSSSSVQPHSRSLTPTSQSNVRQ